MSRIFIYHIALKNFSKNILIRSLDVKTTEIIDIEVKVQQGYHLLLYGLDNENVTTNDLIEEIFFEAKNYSRITKEDVFVIEELSLISNFIF
jgi:hypothetical protein